MVGLGGLFIMGGGFVPHTIPQALGAASVLLASVNVLGGFVSPNLLRVGASNNDNTRL